MLLSFDTKNQIITRTDANRAIANSTDYFEVSVTFSANWNGYDKTICFKNGDTEINIMLVNNAVPKEAHLNLGVGTWKVSIIGIKGNHKILTNAVNLPVGASGYIGTTGPTPRVYEELLTIIQSLHTEVASEAALRSAVEQFVDENFHDIVISDVYSKSEIDSMIVTKTVNDLVYYWNKSQTYNRAEIEALIEAAIQGTYIVAQTLPTTDISTHAIYLVPKESATVGDYYDEYINTTGTSAGWEHIGTTEIDLSNYYTKAEINALLDNKVDKVSGKGLSTNDYDNTAKSIVDGVTSALANKVDKETGKGLSTNDYDNTAKGIVDGVTAALAGKVDKETGKGLSTNDYDNTEKAKLAGIAENATKTEGSLVNGNIKINGTENKVYDDTALDSRVDTVEQDLSTDTATVTGNPLNFSTLTAQKAKETVISLEPIQDLHGYDYPWPAGGGKNKWGNGDVSGTAYVQKSLVYPLPAGTHRFSAVVTSSDTDSTVCLVYNQTNNKPLGQINRSTNGSRESFTITTSSAISNIIFYASVSYQQSTGDTFSFTDIQIELNTSTTTPYEPYANECPIDGRTETGLVGCRKNMFNPNIRVDNGYYNNSGELISSNLTGHTALMPFGNNIDSVLSLFAEHPTVIGANGYYGVYFWNGSQSFISRSVRTWEETKFAFHTPQNCVYISFQVPIPGASSSESIGFDITKSQLELGSTATDYEPFVQSNNLTIQFGEKVYGCTVELEKGTVTVDTEIVDMGTLEWELNSTNRYQSTSLNGIKKPADASIIDNILCSIYKTQKATEGSIGGISSFTTNNITYIRVYDDRGYSASAFKNAMSGVQLVYELATPRTITLTPNEISLLLGVNVISTDANGITLTYRDGKVATLGDLDSLNVALNDALQDTTTDLSEDITTAQNTANTALAYAQNKVYGMRIRESVESNPASIISYLADAVGMTPAHMDYTNNVFDYGSWEDAWFIKDCKPCILGQDGVVQAYLNKNDYTKDIYGNTVTIDENLTGANVMIEFPKIWYKIVPVVPTCCDADVFISPVKLDDDYKDFAYIAQDKTHKEHFYLPAYNGSIINDGTNDVLRSLSGQAVGNSKTGTVEIEMAQRNGTGWYTETFSQVTLINLLLMLIGKSTDTQTVFGRGIDTGSQTAFNAYRTGAGNTKGMFWGSNDGTQLVKVFGIENWWALQWRRFGGLMCVNGAFKYKMCWGQEDGSTTDNYNTDASGYIESPSPAPSGTSGGYISRMFFTSVNMLMSVISGSSSTKYCDGGWFNNSDTTYAFRGGPSNAGAVCGAFALAVNNAVSVAYWILGAALSYT